MARYRFTPARRAALRKAQAVSARKRKGTGKAKAHRPGSTRYAAPHPGVKRVAINPRRKYVVRYHHTNPQAARAIKKHGFNPHVVTRPAVRSNVIKLDSRRDRGMVYLTNKNRGSHFRKARKRGFGGPVFRATVKVKIPRETYVRRSRVDPELRPGRRYHGSAAYISKNERTRIIHHKHLTKASGVKYSYADLTTRRRVVTSRAIRGTGKLALKGAIRVSSGKRIKK